MQIVILRGGANSFIIRDKRTEGFGINIAPGDDMINVFQWAIDVYKQKCYGIVLGGDYNA